MSKRVGRGVGERTMNRVLPWLLALLVVAAQIAYLVIGGWTWDFGIGLSVVASGLVGALLLVRKPENRVGMVMALAGMAGTMAGSFVLAEGGDLGLFLEGISGAGWILLQYALALLLPLWFPTGRPVSRRWAWVGWIGSLATAVFLALWLVQDIPGNPLAISGIENPEESALGSVVLFAFVFFVIAAVASLAVRYRRADDEERHQLKWLVWSLSFFALVGLLGLNTLDSIGSPLPEALDAILWSLLWAAIPVSVGAAILKYRLYEIDRLVSRTVSYSLVVGFLAAVYMVGLTGMTLILPEQSQIVVAATTLAVAALFNPVRSRVQGWVDRRFNRSRYDIQRVMDRFAGSLRDQVDSEQVVDGWVGVVAETMQPAAVGVWLRRETAM